MSAWKSRIVGHDSVDPRELTGNPKNHRKHPQHQREVVRDSIRELGFVKSVIVNKTTGYIIDGHERVWQALNAIEEDPTVRIDVEYVELSEAEEAKALAVLDASTDLAEVDAGKLDELLREFETGSEALSQMLSDLAESVGSFDIDETGMPELADGDREPFQQMTFTLSDDQAQDVKRAIDAAKQQGPFVSDNENSNGNALARIVEAYLGTC